MLLPQEIIRHKRDKLALSPAEIQSFVRGITDHSVSEIAQEVGFGDARNFSTRFAKATGQSPLQYRKSALKPVEGAR